MAGPQVVIVGGGTMGLAAAWALTRRGHAVTVLERHGLVHDLGSHGGHTRVIRQAYHEGSSYVPLVREAEADWLALGQRAGQTLLVRCGLLEFGPDDDPEFRAAIDVCEACGVEHTLMDAATARARWPVQMPDDWRACLSRSGGYLRVVACLRAFASEAKAAGATIRTNTRVHAIESTGDGVSIAIDGETLVADRVVVASGAWLPELLPDTAVAKLVRMRRVLAWTSPDEVHRATLAAMPVWGAFVPEGFFYGFPFNEEGIAGFKLACHTTSALDFLNDPIDPETVDRDAHPRDLQILETFVERYLPLARGPWAQTKVCMYGVTPSWDFLVDRLPADPRIVVAGGFSGHGFKFAPAIGRLVADLVDSDAAPETDFSFSRL